MNGWTNLETFTVYNWLTSDEDTYTRLVEAQSPSEVREWIAEDEKPVLAGLYAALEGVNWDEIWEAETRSTGSARPLMRAACP